MKRELYPIKIEAGCQKAYDKISSFLGEISFRQEHIRGRDYHFLDLDNEGIAKLNPKKNKIELTNKIENWIVDAIDNIKRQRGMK